MRYSYRKITIIKFNQVPEEKNVDLELQWLGSSLGLFNLRDKDKSCYRVFVALIKSAKKNKGQSSDELAEQLELSRGTVVFHLNKLLSAGIVIERDNRYYLREQTLQKLIRNLQQDAIDTYKSLGKIADELDKKIGLD